jgi:AraC-like DNA-binding protein
LLNLGLTDSQVTLARYVPSDEVGFFVEHYWIVRWDLRGRQPFTSQSLTYPSVHVVLERGRSRVVGVQTARFQQPLRGEGLVFGIKFNPGGFHPFVGAEVSRLTNQSVPLAPLLAFGPLLEADVLGVSHDDALMVARAEEVLRRNLPEQDERIPLLSGIVEAIATDRSIVLVDQLVSRMDMPKRGLQRLFREYVGVSPKWVIQRYRLFEAAERLSAGEVDDAQLARELGYFDQAHFIRDFKAVVGRSPQAFVRDLASGSAHGAG